MNPSMRIALLVFCASSTLTAQARSLSDLCLSQLFTSELEAVRAAADRYNPRSIREDREYVGVIIETEGGFGYTVSAAARGAAKWRLAISRIDWPRVRALWHTHGDSASQNRYFSDSDTASAQQFDLPFYLADYTGYLKIYRSGDRTLSPFAAERLSLPRRPGFAIGDYVRDARKRPVRIRVREETRAQSS